ncbi:MAG: sigma-70 family RNA polymerase sigma factor [Candidatus Colwellbacteria bacterium]|nr:sigma-70 family RNA polymerase sigma factor [Candidatus Colwellbacteria bacterium]
MDPKRLKQEFAKAYDDFADAIFRHCYFRLSNRERAKELMQETFMRTWGYIQKGNTIELSKIKPFLYKTASNLIIDEYRRNKNELSLDNLKEDGFEIAEEAEIERGVDMRIELEKMKKVLDHLDDKHREVIVMRYIDNLEPKEIAEVLNDTPNNVSVKINRGIKQIRKYIEDERD